MPVDVAGPAFQLGEAGLKGLGRLGLSLLSLNRRAKLGLAADAMVAPPLGGKLYNTDRLRQLERYLEQRGARLVVGSKDLAPSQVGGFSYGGKPAIHLRLNPTECEVWHELTHYLHYRKIGPEAYGALRRDFFEGSWEKSFNAAEQHVFDQLEGPRRWSLLIEAERIHAADYNLKSGGIR